ncbi:MAG: M48 family metallopeptidase [Gammaproteobacteria bacterium]|nr:M48 family metallopeptidase [Gammaproteobacteria bacterium]
MHAFTILFLAVLLTSVALRLWLSRRQARHVRAHRDAVPAEFAASIPLAAHQKAADYTLARGRLGRIDLLYGALLLVAWTLGGGLQLLDETWRLAGWNALATGTAVLLSVFLITGLLELPVSLYRTFGLEARFGFNKTTPRTFLADLAKGTLLALVLGIPLVALVLWLMQVTGEDWWLWVWAAWTGFTLLLIWAYPTLIAPLFNRFQPLDDDATRERVERLLARCGFSSKGIFVMDGSRRSGHGNAYFTGLGRHKRIVFFDTLLDTLEPAQIEAVLAHELGHFRRRHVLKGMLLQFALSLGALALLAWLMDTPGYFAGLGIETHSTHLALAGFLLVAPVFGFFLQPILAWLSRRHEFEADAFAASQTDADSLIQALVRLYRDNASTLTPDPLHSAIYDSHPPASVRIAHLKSLPAV